MARVIISLPDELLEELDNYCVSYKYNRSECIRKAVRDLMHKGLSEKEKKDE